MIRIHTITRLLIILLLAVSVPASLCRASVEPELTMAVRNKDLRQVRLLLSEGANVNERDEGMEQTPLMRAVQVGDAAIVQILLAHGAEVNAQDDAGQTALMFAVRKGDTRIARILLEKGADADLPDAAGATARAIARERGQGSLVSLLHHQRAFHSKRRPSPPDAPSPLPTSASGYAHAPGRRALVEPSDGSPAAPRPAHAGSLARPASNRLDQAG